MPRLRSVVALVLAAIVWTVSASAAQAAGWIEGPRFGGDGVPAFAALDLAADGTATVAWVEPIVPGGEPTMHLQRIAPDGTPQGIRTLGAAEVSEPSLALTPRGDGFLVWVDDALVVNYAAIGADGSRGTTHALGQTVRGWASAAIDDGGTATIAWLGTASAGPGEAIHVLRLRADGSRTPVRELAAGAAGTTDSLRVAVAPDGTSWAAWNAPGPPSTTSSAWAARIDAAGEVARGSQLLSPPAFEVNALRLTASAAGAVLTWVEEDDAGPMRAVGARLPASGELVGETLAIDAEMARAPAATESTIAPDGTVTAVWPERGTGSSLVLAFRSFPSAGAPTAPQPLSAGTGADGMERSPALGRLPGGALLLASIRDLDDGGPQTPELVVRRIEGDGTVGADLVLGQVAPFPTPAMLAVDGKGGAIAGGYEGDAFESLKLKTWLHPAPPQPDPPGTPTTLSPPPGPLAPSPDQPRPPVARRAAAGLKLGKVARRGAQVTVRGTIARSASGRVTVTWSQRIGRRPVTKKGTARIVRGRWTATLRLSGALARARAGRATVRVSYRGDADTRAASVKRTVRAVAKRKR